MREKIEKWLDGYIAVMMANFNYPDLEDEGISLCTRVDYIHIYEGFDTIADVLGLDVISEERIDLEKRKFIHKTARYKGYKLCAVKQVKELEDMQ